MSWKLEVAKVSIIIPMYNGAKTFFISQTIIGGDFEVFSFLQHPILNPRIRCRLYNRYGLKIEGKNKECLQNIYHNKN